MKSSAFVYALLSVLVCPVGIFAWSIASVDGLVDFVSVTPERIRERTDVALERARASVDRIIGIPSAERTYGNTIRAFDMLESCSDLSCLRNLVELVTMVHPDSVVCAAARQAAVELEHFCIETIGSRYELYAALKEYAQHMPDGALVCDEERRYMDELLASYERRGMSYPLEHRMKIAEVERRIHEVSVAFESNIARDGGSLLLSRDELAGVSEGTIAQFLCDDSGRYTVPCDGPSYVVIMESCSVAATRRAMLHGFLNRGGAANGLVLQELMAARSQLAALLGYGSYAALVLADTMAGSAAAAYDFLYTILSPIHRKVDAEYALFLQNLPDSVLLRDGCLEHWDVAYVRTRFKKMHFDLDEALVAEYFPMDTLIDRIFSVYQDLFGVLFVEVDGVSLWHGDARLFQVSRGGELLGYCVLDLHPRPGKYSHACSFPIVPSFIDAEGVKHPAFAVMIANFPRGTADTPPLWSRNYAVFTFFHELGHILHELLSATRVASFAGTHVMGDFVEMPSQMLEAFMNDPAILRRISCHYKTGDPMPDELIDRIQRVASFDVGFDTQRQIMLALFALDCFGADVSQDPYALLGRRYHEVLRHVAFDPDFLIHQSFSHLTGYGPRYYGYLWSKVYSLDLFASIKERGILDRAVGEQFVASILSRGGSAHPQELLHNFLGRAPRCDSFFASLGITA